MCVYICVYIYIYIERERDILMGFPQKATNPLHLAIACFESAHMLAANSIRLARFVRSFDFHESRL